MDEDLIVSKLAVLKTTSVSQYKLVDLGVHGRQWYRKVASLVKNRMQADLTSRRETQCMCGQYEPVHDCSYTTQHAQILWGWKMERKTKETKQFGLLLSGSLVLSVLQHSVRSARPRLTCINSPTWHKNQSVQNVSFMECLAFHVLSLLQSALLLTQLLLAFTLTEHWWSLNYF